MIIYAELNEQNICIGVKTVGEEMDSPNLVKIDTMDYDLLNRKYENGEWSEEKYLPPEPPLLATIEEQILAESQYQTALLEMQMLGGA